jgi:hypothetical protein
MGLLVDFENEAKEIFDAIDTELKPLGAMLFGALKSAGADLVAEIPALSSKLKNYAEIVVKELATDPQLADALGSWKFGAAAARVWALVKAEVPGLEKLGASVLTGTIETAVQAAFVAMVVA